MAITGKDLLSKYEEEKKKKKKESEQSSEGVTGEQLLKKYEALKSGKTETSKPQYDDTAYRDRYKGKSYEEISSLLGSMSDGEEKDWLNSHRFDYIQSSPDYESKSSTGWSKYLADRDARAKEAISGTEDETFWDKLGRWMGSGGAVDTSLPMGTATQVQHDLRETPIRFEPSNDWTDDQKSIYGYLYDTNPAVAEEYAKYAAKVNEEAAIKKIQESATSNLGAGILNTAGAIAAAPLGMADFLDDLVKGDFSDDGTISPFEYSQAVTEGISTHLNEKGGTLDEDIPIIGGKGFGDVYGLGTSIVQSLASAYTLGPGGTLVSYFGQGAAAGADEAKERGATDSQAIIYGIAVGVFEGVAESIGIDNLFKLGGTTTLKGVIKNILKQAGAEGTEEGLTSLLTNIADNAIMQDKSTFYALVEQYMAFGMSESEAKMKAWLASVEGIAYDTIAGAVSGGVSGGIHTTTQSIIDNTNAKKVYGESSGELVGEALELDPDNAFAKKMQGRLDGGKTLTGAQLNRLATENTNTLVDRDVASIQSAVENRLSELGETGDVKAIAKALTKWVQGESLSGAENKTVRNSKFGRRVANEMNPDNIRSGEYSSSWAERIGTDKINPAEYSKAFATDEESENLTENTSPYDIAVQAILGASESVPETAKVEENVEVKEIASVKDGEVMVRLDGGEVVNAREANLSTETEGELLSAVAMMSADPNVGMDAVTANDLVKGYDPKAGVSVEEYAHGFKDAFLYGAYGFAESELDRGVFTSRLSEIQRRTAYGHGKLVGQERAAQQQAKIDSTVSIKADKDSTSSGKKGKVYREFDDKAINKRQQASLKALEVVAESLGVDIHVFESPVDEHGRHIGASGKYRRSDHSIHIDLYAGESGNDTMLFTAAHELTHFIREWSPAKFKTFADFLLEQYGEKGVSVDELVAKQIEKAEKNGRDIDFDTAYEEVIADSCEAMLTDSNAMEKIAMLKAKDKSLWKKIKSFIKDLVAKIKKVYEGLDPDSDEANYVREMKDAAEKLYEMWTDALVDAGTSYQAAASKVLKADSKAISADEIVTDGAVVTDGNGVKYSIRSMKSDIAEGQMFEDLKTYCGWSQAQVDKLKAQLEDLVAYMTPYRDILDMNETYGRESRRYSPYKPNSDPLYTISMDFSTLCSKRLLTQYVIENLQLRENRPMSAEEQMAIRDMLKEYRKVEKGLQVACVMCYVEAARLKAPKQINKWLGDPATAMRNYFADKNPEFSAYIKKSQEDFKESRGYARDAVKKDMSAKDVTALNKIRPKVRAEYNPSAEEMAIIETAKSLPNGTYLTAGNLAELSEKHPEIYKAYTAFIRTATRSKSLETDEPYYYGDSRRDNGNGIIVSDSFIESVNRENGMRFSSWSDWRIQHLLDFISAVIDNSVRGAAMHGYTKYADEVRVLGKTGMMFNLSGVAGTQTGLNEDGSLNFSDTESIDIDEAIALREEFPETAGLQCIGVSKEHILALLRSDIIDYVIPYHTSGLNATLRRMGDIYGWDDFTPTQHATPDSSIKKENAKDPDNWHKEPIFSEFFVGYDTGLSGTEAMRQSADNYIRMCRERGLTPKFQEFSKEPNYWKLLIDRKMVNQKNDTLIQQKPVTPDFDFDVIKGIVDKYVQNYDSGLESRAFNYIVENWDSVPNRIRDLKKQGTTKAKTTKKAIDKLANETLAAQPKPDEKLSDRGYSYDALVSKPDMKLTTIGGNILSNRADVVAEAKKNAAKVGKFNPKDGSVSVRVNDIGVDVVISTGGLRHSLDRRFDVNAPVAVKAGEILQNSIKINEMTPENPNADSSYALIGAARNEKGELYIVRSVVNRFKNELVSMDVLYAINAKTEPNLGIKKGNQVGAYPQGSLSEDSFLTDSTISIAQLLEFVNKYFPDVLPESVLRHFGHDFRPEGKLGESVLYSDRNSYAPTFYSHMGKVVDGIKSEKVGAAGVVPYLKGKGVKAEEIKWSGIEAWLEGKKSVTKAELQEFVAGSQLQIVEELGEGGAKVTLERSSYGDDSWDVLKGGEVVDTYSWSEDSGLYESDMTGGGFATKDRILEYFQEKYGSGNTRWEKYKIDGGTNYRELVFRLPDSSYSNQAMRVHWGEDADGVLVHARMQDITTEDGKKMLFIEELQSDWHNEGLESGYVEDSDFARIDKLKEKADDAFFDVEDYSMEMTGSAGEWDTIEKTPKGAKLLKAYREAKATYDQAMDESLKKIPDAPFHRNYHEFVLKRLVRMAAEEGYDSIGWTPSEIQSERWSDEFEKAYRIEYDQDMPSFMRKYGKKWGAKVGKEYVGGFLAQFDIDINTSMDDDVWLLEEGVSYDGTEVWSMDIPDAMKNSVLYDGQAMYQDRDPDSVSNRSLLAGALDSVAQNDIERSKLAQYKQKIELIQSEERELHELREQIKELSFAKGPKDTAKIRSLQSEATRIANRINTFDRQLLTLEASAPLKAVLEREKALAYKKAEKKGKEALARYKEKAADTQRELMTRYQESRKKGVEGRRKTEMRHKIKNVVTDLNKLLLEEDKKHHVPESMKKAVAAALAAVNMDTVGADERIAKLNQEMMSAKTPEKVQEISRKIDHIKKMGDKLKRRLQDLHDAYEDILSADDPEFVYAYDVVVANAIQNAIKDIGDTPIRDMSLEQLEQVYDMYKMVLSAVRNANRSFVEGRKEAMHNRISRTIGEVRRVGGERKLLPANTQAIRAYRWNNLKPIYAMERIGSGTFTDAFMDLIDGEGVYGKDVTHAADFAEEMQKKYGYDKWDFKKKYRFVSNSGLEFELTLEQIMSLYAYSKREQAFEHLNLGGFVFDNSIEVHKETEKDGKTKRSLQKYTVNIADAHQLDLSKMHNIVKVLDDISGAKGFVDEMQDYLSTVMGEKGNEITMQMYEIKLFKEKHYFPLKSAKQFMFEQNEVAGEVRIKNSGFTNKTQPGANNPIILSNFMDVWANHVHDMSMYHAFVLPLEDFNRIFNGKTPKAEGHPSVAVKSVIQNAYGAEAVQYVKQLITDLNGGARSDPRESTAKALLGKWKKAQVIASWSVIVQQPTAAIRAMSMVNAKYFEVNPRLISHNKMWEEIKKYAPVAIIKEMGRFDMDTGRGTVEYIKNDKNLLDKVDDFFSWLPAKADEWAWIKIWMAVKKETHAKHKDLKVDSEEFLSIAGKRFTEIIVKTQVYDSTLARSANMRSKSLFMNMATSFLAEPTTSINMLEQGLREWGRGNKAVAAKTFASVYASVIVNALAVSVVYAMRDDDDDETLLEKYLSSLTVEVIEGINPITHLPFLKDAWSLLQGFDVERGDMALYSDILDTLNKLTKLSAKDTEDMTEEELKKHYKSIIEESWSIVDHVSSFLGIGEKNVRRDVMSVVNLFKTLTNGQKDNAGDMWDAILGEIKDATPIWNWFPDKSRSEKLYDALEGGNQTRIERIENRYKDQDAFELAVRQALRGEYEEGDLSDSQAVDMLVDYGGKAEDEAIAMVMYWAFKQDNPDTYVDDSWISEYYADGVAEAGISVETFVEYRNEVKGITGEGKKERRMAIINSLPITNAQKDALYLAEGWTESRIYEAPWH